ncbi:flagellar basal body-associated FliL family protein [Marinobacter sp. X15-166B]|uniref:flagellar basal body-associated FliL family protein n=1 Tax=Marinobacter sp. X15-166B TaxID=1897620 RepID=UPI00085C589E|nr:flagellar basal body-associated FliL family protein [Marinobacter sp. X15-166B]OEY67972.1 flagellar basal body protein FliL [Marinobacter sp. X15-166B]
MPRLFLLFVVLAALVLPPPGLTAHADETSPAQPARPRTTDYIELKPDFVTNVGLPGHRLSYLKAAVTLRASDTATRAAVEAHMPRMRHELVLLFAEQTDAEVLTSTTGQSSLRDEAARRLNAALAAQQTGAQIDSVLFTTFVVQR